MSNARDIADAGHQLVAWVNFNGAFDASSLSPANQFTLGNGIHAAYNVSSITDGGYGGPYTITFENSLDDGNYALAGFAKRPNTSANFSEVVSAYSTDTKTGTAIAIRTTGHGSTSGQEDVSDVSVAIFR
jgi:hypothetical protein